MHTGESSATTNGIRVSAKSFFVPERSAPEKGHYFFGYQIIIQNNTDDDVQLLSRHWHITDGSGRVDQVRGLGVVGQQPVLTPGEAFAYTSACPLSTPVGSMHGTFEFERTDGSLFDAEVAPFPLALPQSLN